MSKEATKTTIRQHQLINQSDVVSLSVTRLEVTGIAH